MAAERKLSPLQHRTERVARRGMAVPVIWHLNLADLHVRLPHESYDDTAIAYLLAACPFLCASTPLTLTLLR